MLIPFSSSADVIVDRYAVFIIYSEVPYQAASAAEHVQPHQFRIVFMLTESLEDARNIFGSGICNCLQIIFLDVCRTETEHAVDDCLIDGMGNLQATVC